jgi:integrase
LRGDWSDPDLGRVSLEDFGARWLTHHRMSDRTRTAYEMAHGLLASGRSEDAKAKAYRLLRAILNTAVDDGRIRRNPCRIKGADRVRSTERPVASVPQVYALAGSLGRWRVFVLAAAFTGLRWGELIALRRRDIDLVRQTVAVHRSFIEHEGRIVVGPTKSEAGVRVVALPSVLVDELSDHLATRVGPGPDALVFTGERGATPKRGGWPNRIDWPPAVRAAGLPEGFHFHDLRHTGTTWRLSRAHLRAS